MNSPDNNPHDPIDKLLLEQNTHLADDGFTQRVIVAIPRRRPVFPRIILLAVAIVGTAVAVYWMPWKNLPPPDYTQVFAQNSKVLSAWLPFIAVSVALVSAVLAAIRQED